jgi:hypothetical protein
MPRIAHVLIPAPRRSTTGRWVAFAILLAIFAVLLLLPALAHAQVPDPCAAPAALPPPDGVMSGLLSGLDPFVALLAQGSIAAGLIVGAMLWLRKAFPARFAPEPATEHARFLNMGTALLIGLLFGLVSVAPPIPIPGHASIGFFLVVGQVLGGFLVATAAVFGRDFLVRGQGVIDERKAAAAPAPVEPGK